MKALRVTEGVAGMWHYHWAREGEFRSLCGHDVMNTSIPPEQWGLSGNPELHETWCRLCAALKAQQ